MQPKNETINNAEKILSPEDQQAYAELSSAYMKVYGREPDLDMLDSLSEEEQDQIIDQLLQAESI
jgi:hypothetical protein